MVAADGGACLVDTEGVVGPPLHTRLAPFLVLRPVRYIPLFFRSFSFEPLFSPHFFGCLHLIVVSVFVFRSPPFTFSPELSQQFRPIPFSFLAIHKGFLSNLPNNLLVFVFTPHSN